MSEGKVVSLCGSQDVDQAAIGAKAMSLVRMSRMGLAVPPAFCVVASAFREHLEQNGLVPVIESTLAGLGEALPEEQTALLSRIRQVIVEAPVRDGLLTEIGDHYRDLGVQQVAVRSSATAEDLPAHSFAGQYESYLGITDLAECIEAIKKCWASLWTHRAYSYRAAKGLEHLSIDMAVIVQSLVDAQVSGVVFSLDPVSGRSDRLVVEACFGLGDSLVSGKATPDRFVLAKESLRVLSQIVSEKTIERVPGECGGIEERPLAVGRDRTPSLRRRMLRKLALLAKRAERAFGSPQDMEWAARGKDIFFLQSRPVTAVAPSESWKNRQVWTNANLGEVIPDVVTPVNWSLVKVLGTAIFDSIFSWIGIDFGDNPLIGKVAGRAYFNINTFDGAIRHFPGLRKMDLSQVLGGEQGKMLDLGQLKIREEDIPDFKFSRLKFVFKMPGFVFRILTHSPRRGVEYVAEMKGRGERLLRMDLRSLSDDTIVAHLESGVNEIYEEVHGIAFSGLGMFNFAQLGKICRNWLGDREGSFANVLLAGVGDMDVARAGLELWGLAAKARENPEVGRAVLLGDGWQVARKRISKLEGGKEFLGKWDRFMKEHGHHTRGELEVYNPRWSEMPDYILNTVRAYLRGSAAANPPKHYQERARERDQLAAECRKRLKNPIKRIVFNFHLAQAQRGCVLRENIKSVAVIYWAAMRSMLLELGERLAKRGTIEDRDDIFFLEFDEVGPVARGEVEFDVSEAVASRRAEYNQNLAVTTPKVVVGKFDPDTFVSETVPDDVEVLSGIAVCPGVVTGPARVILKSDTDEHIQPGEILVAPFTDPGWTPYLLPAAAIVVDQGGLLSHGSIIAREYGIPTVVNVGPATKLVKTGETIQVDGNRGVMRILR